MEQAKMLERMRRAGFEVIECESGDEARALLLDRIEDGATVGVGGSMSLREIGALDALSAKGCDVLTSWGANPANVADIRERSRTADVYLSSANAVTGDGRLVFIDGNCNRVGAILDGPKRVYFVIGENKLTGGGLQAALARAKREACPPNARRLKLDTPCARDGKCDEQACGDACMCRATVVLDRPPHGRKMTVLLVRGTLGY